MGRSEAQHFCLVGQFLGYELKGYKIYRVHLRNPQGEYRLKLSSSARDDLLRAALQGDLQVGDWMEVAGTQAFKEKDGRVKLKIYQVERILEPSPVNCHAPIPPTAPGPKTQILVCQKSSCCKRGGKAMCGALGQWVEEQGLGDRVRIKTTGCLKNCGQGPNMIVGKTRYHHVQADDIPKILGAHFPPAGIEALEGMTEEAVEPVLSQESCSRRRLPEQEALLKEPFNPDVVGEPSLAVTAT